MTTLQENMSIGAFARAAEVGVETIRFYQRKGLLPEPHRPYGSIRRYGAADVARVRFIKSAQRLGFSLDEVGELLRLEDGAHCAQAAELAARRLADVRARLADLERMEAALAQLLAECQTRRGQISCPLIKALHGGAPSPATSQRKGM
ncbi:Hg(II)-responsive transcriptional regulator [Sulfuricystis multivorans]|uniref:Hg(II)-responsive transcriptional regulator n=1 Tax=Sulfuricystis multivorans TaxID=2211108 RepID=UPI000F832CE2|nr:Hg(II)-responsive transcriptional regulator [Sulfuricystis multivorans]